MSHITTVTRHDPRGSGGAPAPPDKPRASRRGLRRIGAVLAGSVVLAALLLLLANLAFAQSAQKKTPPDLKPFLVEDIYPGKTGSEPSNLVNFKGRLLFGANHPRFGEELWRSNGARSGTRLVKDIDPGPLKIRKMEDTEAGSSAPDKVLRTKKWVYFAAITAKNGEEMWRSDGTERGTKIVKDIVPGPGDSGAEDFVTIAPKTTLFRAWDAAHGEELWRTDGTEKGTRLVKDINLDTPPGPRCDQDECGIPKGWSHPDTPTAMGGTLFFAADDGKHGVELWKSDGTEKGTTLVKDINTTPGNSNPNDKGSAVNRSAEVEKLFVVGKTLYFRANDGKHGVELWKSDGTERGTTLVKDINTAAPAPTNAACTRRKSCAGSSWADEMTVVGKTAGGRRLYFSANDGKHGVELWKSDGTKKGTTLVKDINTGRANSDADNLTAFKGRVLLTADDGVHGTEMWRSNGTKANTALLINLEPGKEGSEPGELTTSGPFLYFAASTPSAGEELWAVLPRGIGR